MRFQLERTDPFKEQGTEAHLRYNIENHIFENSAHIQSFRTKKTDIQLF